jgi:SWI/SNF-related matrix-associated actin-dependent regulator of chromatin subfamily A member 5
MKWLFSCVRGSLHILGKIANNRNTALTEAQRFWYYRMLLRTDTMTLNEIFKNHGSEYKGRDEAQLHVAQALAQSQASIREGAKVETYQKLMNLLMQLRRICDHPYILNGCLPEPYAIGEHIVATSSKLIFLDKLLADLLPKGERVLIFSQWTS